MPRTTRSRSQRRHALCCIRWAGYYVLFGTGKFFESGDQADLQVHSVYGLWDRGGTGTIPKTGPGAGDSLSLTLSDAATTGFRSSTFRV